jgi:hypothetical protein
LTITTHFYHVNASFKHFKAKGFYSSWDPADRIDALDAKDSNGNIDYRQRDLNNIITIIAGCCAKQQV